MHQPSRMSTPVATRARGPLVGLAVLLVAIAASASQPSSPAAPDPFEFFHPQVSVSPPERARLDRGETLVKSVSPVDGQVAIFSAARTQVDGDRLVRWVRRVDAMKRGRYVSHVVRFSDPPRLDDLRALDLDADDLDALRQCRPGSCGLKLNDSEMTRLSALARARRPGWQGEVQQAFRTALLERTETYLASGFAGTAALRDREAPVVLANEFQGLLAQTSFLPQSAPSLASFFVRFPQERSPAIESFLYWSKEQIGRKPLISITHVAIQRPTRGPDVIVASRQIYATHYVSGSIAVTAIVGERGSGPHYLAYFNRSRVDVLDGFFGGLVRRIVERRLRDEAGDIVAALRTRLEAGEPE